MENINSNWLNTKVSLYTTHRDNTGKATTYLDILYHAKDTDDLKALRKLDINDPDYDGKSKILKAKLKCFTPSALLESKATDNVTVVKRTGIAQIDFDSTHLKNYNLEELIKKVYSLKFVGYCGRSCRGNGFYALILIAEPERLTDYVEHCFEVFKSYGLRPDESKGRNVSDLRYLSYDPKRLIRKNPEALHVVNFRRKVAFKRDYEHKPSLGSAKSNDDLIERLLKQVQKAQPGERHYIIRRVAYTFGGFRDPTLLQKLKEAILNNDTIEIGNEANGLKCADDCFKKGWQNPYAPNPYDDFK